jgi:hypothetical protein
MVSVADRVPLKLAEIAADVMEPTPAVATEKLAAVAPPSTVTVAGISAATLSLESVTTAPLAGAGLLIVTVPVDDEPPRTLPGLTETPESTGGLRVKMAVLVPL